jgi:NADPH-dependent glutamate synthase beta subunit-like oxidoreductase
MAESNRDTLTPIVQKVEALMVRNNRGHPGFTLTIDGKKVQAYETQALLSVAIDNGITDIPNLCSDGELEPAATCRMCLVSVEGVNRLLPACSTMAQPGVIVTTKSDELFHIRRTNLEVLPFPYILGLTCPAPCQKACRRALVEEEIAICRMHGHAAETCLLDPPLPFVQDPPTGKKVAIVGAGPAGLTCAYYLAFKGHSCKVFDMQPQPGGMLRYGIPEYRLPKDVMDRELNHVFQLGVDLQSNVKLGRDFTIDDLFAQGFDAVYLAIGAWTSNPLDAPGEDADGVVNAITFLAEKVEGKPVPVKEGTEVVVLGGGFTAFDCTRTSLRLGAQMYTGYRRSVKEMTATPEEIEDAEAEGTAILFYVQQTRVITAHGNVTGLEFVKTKLGESDVSGRRRPVPLPGSEFVIDCDTIIPAFDQNPDMAVLDEKSGVKWTKRGTIQTDPHHYMTDRHAVFAGGDAQMGAKTIIECVAQGKLV